MGQIMSLMTTGLMFYICVIFIFWTPLLPDWLLCLLPWGGFELSPPLLWLSRAVWWVNWKLLFALPDPTDASWGELMSTLLKRFCSSDDPFSAELLLW